MLPKVASRTRHRPTGALIETTAVKARRGLCKTPASHRLLDRGCRESGMGHRPLQGGLECGNRL